MGKEKRFRGLVTRSVADLEVVGAYRALVRIIDRILSLVLKHNVRYLLLVCRGGWVVRHCSRRPQLLKYPPLDRLNLSVAS